MFAKLAAGFVAATAVLAVEAAVHEAAAQQRRRAVPEVRVTRPSWLTTPKVSFPGDRLGMRPDIIHAPYTSTGEFVAMSSTMRGVAGSDRFWGSPAWTVQWPWPAAFYAGN